MTDGRNADEETVDPVEFQAADRGSGGQPGEPGEPGDARDARDPGGPGDADGRAQETGDHTGDATFEPGAGVDEDEDVLRPRHAHAESNAGSDAGLDTSSGAAADPLGGPEQSITWSAPPAQPTDTPPYGTPSQSEAPRYGSPQWETPRYEAPQYDPPRYEAPHYEAPRYDSPQSYAPPPFQPLAPSTPPPPPPTMQSPAMQSPAMQPLPAPQQPTQYQRPQYDQSQYQQPQYDQSQYQPPAQQPPAQQPPAQQPPAQQRPRHYAPEQIAYQPQPPYAPGPGSEAGAGPASAPPSVGAHAAPPEQPSAPPRPEDLLEPNQTPVTAEPASHGWRGRLNRGSFGMVKAKPGPEEIALRRAITGIQRSFSRPMTVVVVQPKGGAGKTPTTICLSAAFGAHRGGYVVGWDDNETRGTLAVRVANPDDKRTTVWDLLSDLAAFERFDARVGDLSYYVRAQPDAHFDALVSDDNPGNMAQIGEDEFHRLHRVLQRFYRMMVVDTGNNVRSPNWQAAVNAADLVVVVSTYQRDAGYSGSWVLDHLAQTGREELARNAITVLTAADPTTDKTVRQQLIEHFSARTRAVTEIPYDQQLAHGGPIRWTDLAPRTRNAWILAGATIVDALVERDQQSLAARRA
jgi:MinD-like ATPase involved in chromosome partitioning or flagellar assembly